MHVLQVVGQAAGGLHRHLEQLLTGLKEHRFIVAGPADVVRDLGSYPNVSACWEITPVTRLAPGTLHAAARALRQRLTSTEGRDVQLIHLHGWATGASFLADARRHAPVVWTVHNMPPRGMVARFWVGRLVTARGGNPLHVVAVSESLARSVLSTWPALGSRVWAVRNGLDPEELQRLTRLPRGRRDWTRRQWAQAAGSPGTLLPEPAREGGTLERVEAPAVELPLPVPVLGYMGRLWAPKGALDAVEVLAILVRAGWPAVLEVAGTGPHQAAMLRLARQRGIVERIAFLGWQHPADFLARIDLLLHPSRAEGGVPYAVMEAMAAGVPVVAARLPPLEEVAGELPVEAVLQLARPGHVAELARATAECLNDPEGTARRAQAAAVLARRLFRVEQALEATRRIYRTATGQAAALAGPEEGPVRPHQGLAGPGEPGL